MEASGGVTCYVCAYRGACRCRGSHAAAPAQGGDEVVVAGGSREADEVQDQDALTPRLAVDYCLAASRGAARKYISSSYHESSGMSLIDGLCHQHWPIRPATRYRKTSCR